MDAAVERLVGAALDAVRAGRDETEQGRTLAPSVVEALIDAGLFRLGVPLSLGGPEPGPFEVLDVLEALTEADVSAAWCVWNNLLPALLGRQLDPDVRRARFADPREVFGNSTRAQGRAVRHGDRYRVSGRWSLVSGCLAATQVMVLCTVVDADDPDARPGPNRFVYLPAEAVRIEDTWVTAGLRGTGSHDVVADDVEVAVSASCSYLGPARSAEGPLDRFPIMAFMAAGAASMLLGLASICVRELVATARASVVTDGRPQAATRPAVAAGVARGAADVASARLALRAALAALWDTIPNGTLNGTATDAEFAALYQSVDLARRNALQTVRAAHELGGTAALYQGGALERAHRDALVMAQHIMFDPMWAEQAGRVHLGLAATNPLFNH